MTFTEYKQLCLKYNLKVFSYDGRDYGVCNVPFVGWGNHIRVIPESVWKNQVLSDNVKYLTYIGEFQYYPDEIKKNNTQAFENYLIKLTAWLKQLRIDTKLQLIQMDFK